MSDAERQATRGKESSDNVEVSSIAAAGCMASTQNAVQGLQGGLRKDRPKENYPGSVASKVGEEVSFHAESADNVSH